MVRAVLLTLLVMALPVQADLKCDIDLKFGLVVNDRHIRVLDESRTVYQINDMEQLIVQGEWLRLDDVQQAKLAALAEGLHYVVPKMTILATEGVELAVETVEHVYVGLVGSDHKSYDKLQSALQRVQNKIKEKFIHAGDAYYGDNYYIGPGSMENVDDLVDRGLEEQIEQAINTSLGGVLSAIGGLSAGGDEEKEQRMESLSQRLELVGQEIERQVGPKADSLRLKAKWFCNKMHHLNEIEDSLRASVPEMKKFDVILTQDSIEH